MWTTVKHSKWKDSNRNHSRETSSKSSSWPSGKFMAEINKVKNVSKFSFLY